MDRRHFLRFAVAAPVVPALGTHVPVAGVAAATLKMEFPTLSGSWFTVGETIHLHKMWGRRPTTLAEQVEDSANEMLDLASRASNFGALAEKAVDRLTDAVIGSVEKFAAAIPSDPAVQKQMDDDDLFDHDGSAK